MDDDELTTQIEAEVNEWSTNSTECLNISLVRADGTSTTAEPFSPEFTYPVFGEEEAIFGYQGLNIEITFAAHNLRPKIRIQYSKAFEAQGEVAPTDIKAALEDFLPVEAFSEPDDAVEEDASECKPPGERIHAYNRDGEDYEIWCASLVDEDARQLLENMGMLVPLFIEGGSMLSLDQDWTTQRWKLFLVYALNSSSAPHNARYELVGFGTSYRVFTLPGRNAASTAQPEAFSQSLEAHLAQTDDSIPSASTISSPLDLPSRERLSQFLILPQHQNSGHGSELYGVMYGALTTPANILELTIEDPNEAFDDLRDVCDLTHLRANVPEFAALRINTSIGPESLGAKEDVPIALIVDGETRARIMKQTKIVSRQFDRLVEMHTLSFIPNLHRSRSRLTRKEKSSSENDKAYYFWRLYAKQRLYIHNRDQLAQVEKAERVEKLEGALDGVVEGYVKVLEKVQKRERVLQGSHGKARKAEESEVSVGASGKQRGSKRKMLPVDDEDEDEDVVMVSSEDAVLVNARKRVRVSP